MKNLIILLLSINVASSATVLKQFATTNTATVVSNIIQSLSGVPYNSATNTWTLNTDFKLGTNTIYTGAANTIGITGVTNKSTSTEIFGQLTIIATGDIIFTNPVSIHTSDFLNSRTVTNGNNAVICIDLIPGVSTNLAILQFK